MSTKIFKAMWSSSSSYIKTIIDFIYPSPSKCPICQQSYLQNTAVPICYECNGKITFIKDNGCSICGKPLLKDKLFKREKCLSKEGQLSKVEQPSKGEQLLKKDASLNEKSPLKEATHNICVNCSSMGWSFSRGKVIGIYEGFLRQCILDFKYLGQWHLAKPLGMLMGEFVKVWNEVDRKAVIIPVPLHMDRLNERGYNQSQLLAGYVEKVAGLPMSSDILLRINSTEPQKGLTVMEREKNLKNAFAVTDYDKINNRNILLIDDIMTTGVTVDQCSKVLLGSGAQDVKVLALAAGRMD